MRKTVRLTGTEQERLVVLNRVPGGDLTTAEVAIALQRPVCQMRRMLATYRKTDEAVLEEAQPLWRLVQEWLVAEDGEEGVERLRVELAGLLGTPRGVGSQAGCDSR
jgi:hypothetical protein